MNFRGVYGLARLESLDESCKRNSVVFERLFSLYVFSCESFLCYLVASWYSLA